MSRPLCIVRATPFFAERMGGCVTQGRLVAAELARRGHDVRVVTTDVGLGPETERGRWLQRSGYRLLYAPATRAWHRAPPYAAPARARRALAEALDGADVLGLNVGLTLLNRTAVALARRRGVPWVYNAEGALCPVRLRLERLRKAVFLAAVERPLLRAAPAVQAVTEAERRDVIAQGAAAERVAVIPNGVDAPGTSPPDARQACRRLLRLPPEAEVVLFLGRLHALKGLDLLLAAFAAVAGRFPAAHLVLAGPDEGVAATLGARAAQLGVAGRVRLPGLLLGADKEVALAGSDVFALTSRSEGQPNAVLEALARGLPCLVTAGARVPEVGAGGAGCEVAPTVAGVAGGLAALLADPGARARAGERALELARQRFALTAAVDRLEWLYRDLAEGGGGKRPWEGEFAAATPGGEPRPSRPPRSLPSVDPTDG